MTQCENKKTSLTLKLGIHKVMVVTHQRMAQKRTLSDLSNYVKITLSGYIVNELSFTTTSPLLINKCSLSTADTTASYRI